MLGVEKRLHGQVPHAPISTSPKASPRTTLAVDLGTGVNLECTLSALALPLFSAHAVPDSYPAGSGGCKHIR